MMAVISSYAQADEPPNDADPTLFFGAIDMDFIDALSASGDMVQGRDVTDGDSFLDATGDQRIDYRDMAFWISLIEISDDSIGPLQLGSPTTELVQFCTIGDYVVNGVVDQDDFDWWVANVWNTPMLTDTESKYSNGDTNGDGYRDILDAVLLIDLSSDLDRSPLDRLLGDQ